MAKEESTKIMKTQTEIQAVNPKDSALMIPQTVALSKNDQLNISSKHPRKRKN